MKKRLITIALIAILCLGSAAAQTVPDKAGTRALKATPWATRQHLDLYKKGLPKVSLSIRGNSGNWTLFAPYPNPFRTETSISYLLPQQGMVSLQIRDLNGRILKTWQEQRNKGNQTTHWDGRDDAGNELGAGIYFCSIIYNGTSKVKKLIKE